METKTYTRLELKDFIESDNFNNLITIPISIHRAISQINNPRASDTDILLVVEFDDNKVVGYLGVLPDYIFYEDRKEKIGWLSCFWTDEKYRSKDVAANLFLRVMQTWKQKTYITNIVPWLESVYQQTKIFQPTKYKIGLKGYMRFNFAEILPPKKKIFKKSVSFLKIVDFFLNIINDIRLSFYKNTIPENIKHEYIPNLDDKSSQFINTHKIESWSQRGKEEINWILSNPWIIEGAKTDYNSKRYYFSSVSKRFFYQIVKLTNQENTITGIFILCVRNNNLTIPYIFSNTTTFDNISKIIIDTMLRLKISVVTTFNEGLINSLKKIHTPFYLKKSVKKPYLLPKTMNYLNELNFQDGDGDCAFY
jgi:hypothetical protein